MISLTQKTSSEIDLQLAKRIAGIRKRQKISQQTLASRSGVSFGSIKRFEQTGDISLQSLTKIAIALGIDEQIEALFSDVPFESIEEIING